MTASVVRHRERARSVGPPEVGGRGRRELVAVALWAAVIVAAHVWGRWLQARGHRLYLNLPPLVGHLDVRVAGQGVVALALAPVAVLVLPRLIAARSWGRVLSVAFVAAVAWALALALTEGVGGVLASPSSPRDYLAGIPADGSALEFVRTYLDRIQSFPTHLRAHPPGMGLVAFAVDRLGGGPAWIAGLEILVGASAVPAVLLATRDVAGEERARAAAPFLALMPAAVTLASSGDAFFLGVGAWAVALVVLSTGAEGRRSTTLALAGGLLFGVNAFLSYGLVLLATIPLVVAVARRRSRPIALAAVGAVPVFLAFGLAGFSWFAGISATRLEYLESVARLRPYQYFVFANLAALAIVLGPATAAGLSVLRDRGTWLLVGGALIAVALADLSGMSKAEVERIWLPFVPWIALAAGALPERTRGRWLGVNVAFGLGLELAVRQPW